jgi:DNA polymerase-4
LTLKIKYSDFTQITRSYTQSKVLNSKDTILPIAKKLLQQISYSANHPIRLMGLSVTNNLDYTDITHRLKDDYYELELEFKKWPDEH